MSVNQPNVVRNPAVTQEKAALAKKLRRHPTDEECVAWELLRGRRCLGLKFRRQQVIQGFIADFYCAEHRLALELDGPVHDEQKDYDDHRDEALAHADVEVLRFRNDEITRERLEELLARAIGSPVRTGRLQPPCA